MRNRTTATRERIRGIYDRQARFYDLATWFYYLVGMRIRHWRRLTVDALALKPGDTVVEVGCGTGLNFGLLEDAVGADGHIIGVDISEAMLDRARKRIDVAGWRNVELTRAAAADFDFPDNVAGIFATGVLTYEPEFDQVIKRGAKALAPGGRWVVLDYKRPDGWLRILAPLFIALGSIFGVSKECMEREVWKSVKRHLKNTKVRELYGGFVYIAAGNA